MATTNKDGWTEAKCLQLIQEFKERPLLWDQKCHLYYKKTLKPPAWVEIGEAMDLSADKCRHKMVILMSSFRREKAKLMNTLKKRQTPYKSLWFAFHPMSFLLKKGFEKKGKSPALEFQDTDDESNTDEEMKCNITLDEHLVEQIQRGETPPENDEQDTRPRKISRTDNQYPPTSQQNEHEISYFSNFIAAKMMKYNEATKNAVQQAICEVIFKADQNCYGQTPNGMQASSSNTLNKPSNKDPINADENLYVLTLNEMQANSSNTFNRPSNKDQFNANENCNEQTLNEVQASSSRTLNKPNSAIVQQRSRSTSSDITIKVHYSDSD